MNTTLELFDSGPIPAATPRNQGRIFTPVFVNGNWHCKDQKGKPCQFYDWHYFSKGWKCRHILQRENAYLNTENDYLKTRKERKSTAKFSSFEQVMSFFEKNKSFELEYLCDLALNLAKAQGSVTTEDLYETVKGKFKADARILGSAVSGLGRLGLLQKLWRNGKIVEITTRRKKNHGNKLKVWILTEDGRAIFQETTAAVEEQLEMETEAPPKKKFDKIPRKKKESWGDQKIDYRGHHIKRKNKKRIDYIEDRKVREK